MEDSYDNPVEVSEPKTMADSNDNPVEVSEPQMMMASEDSPIEVSDPETLVSSEDSPIELSEIEKIKKAEEIKQLALGLNQIFVQESSSARRIRMRRLSRSKRHDMEFNPSESPSKKAMSSKLERSITPSTSSESSPVKKRAESYDSELPIYFSESVLEECETIFERESRRSVEIEFDVYNISDFMQGKNGNCIACFQSASECLRQLVYIEAFMRYYPYKEMEGRALPGFVDVSKADLKLIREKTLNDLQIDELEGSPPGTRSVEEKLELIWKSVHAMIDSGICIAVDIMTNAYDNAINKPMMLRDLYGTNDLFLNMIQVRTRCANLMLQCDRINRTSVCYIDKVNSRFGIICCQMWGLVVDLELFEERTNR